MTAPQTISTMPPQYITESPRVLSFPVGTALPEFLVTPGTQCYALWCVSQGGIGSNLRIGFGSTGTFFRFREGVILDLGCAPINDGIRLDFAGVQTETIEFLLWTFYAGGSGDKVQAS